MKPACADSGGRTARGRWQEDIQQAFFCIQFGLVGHVFKLFLTYHLNRNLNQIANHGLNIPPHVSDFSEFRRFDFEERRVGELGQPAGDFGFPYACGTDHDDVLGNHFFGEIRRKLLPPHAVAQRNRHRALGVFLSDDVLVEFGDDLTRREFVESNLFFVDGSG